MADVRKRRGRTRSFSVVDEARVMAALVVRGASPIERVREDIRVSASDEQVLLKSLHALDVERIINFRQAILYEFEKMLANQ
jgi:hypothetical protein